MNNVPSHPYALSREQSYYERGQIRQKFKTSNGSKETINLNRLAKANFLNSITEVILLKNLRHENLFQSNQIMFDKESLKVAVRSSGEEKVASFAQILDSSKMNQDQIKFLMFQLFSVTNYLHFNGLVARSINPSNIMINSHVNLFLNDFSSFRLQRLTKNYAKDYRMDVNYAAPETSLNLDENFYNSDSWSLGCILFELLAHKPLFRVHNSFDYLRSVLQCLGSPAFNDDLKFINNRGTIKWIFSQTIFEKRKASSWLNDPLKVDPLLLDLLDKCLVFDPRKRISCLEALEHPYFSDLYDQAEEKNSLINHIEHIDFKKIFSNPLNSENQIIEQLMKELAGTR